MRLNKIFIVSLIILAILTVGAVSASDNVTSDDLSIGLEDADVQESSLDDDLTAISDDSDDEKVNEEIEETDNVLSKEYDDIIGVEESDANTIIGKEVTNDEPVLTSTDKEVLSKVPDEVKITFLKQTGKTTKDKKIYFKVTDVETGKGVHASYRMYYGINGKFGQNIEVSTNSKGIGTLKWSKFNIKGNGVFSLRMGLLEFLEYTGKTDDGYDEYNVYNLVGSNEAAIKVTIKNVGKQTVVIKPKKLSTSFKSGKYFKAKVINSKTKKPVKGVKVIFKVYTNKKAKKVTLTSNSKGLIKYSSSKLKVGKHKVVLKVKKSKKFKGKTKKSLIKISKAKLKVSSPKVTAKYKKSKLFKVTVKNKASKKPVKGIKVIMKVYTGKKYKKIVHKTNKKGKTGFNTKILSRGKHKVVVVIKANSKYKKAVKRSSVTIKGKANNNKNKNSNAKKGKLRTKLTIEECYRTGNIGEIFVKVSLKDSKGRPLANKEISIDTVAYVGVMSQSLHNTVTTNSKGIAQGYVSSMFGGISTYDVTVKFSGDKSHKSSSAGTYLG